MGRPASVAALAMMLVGCGPCGGDRAGREDAGAAEPTKADEAPPVGTVEGIVRVAEGVTELPAYAPPDIGLDAGRTFPDVCTPPRVVDRQPVQMGEGRAAIGVMVAATGDRERFRVPEVPPREHRVAIRDCRLTPMLIVATRGDRLMMENEMDHPFLPSLGQTPFHEGLLRGEPRTITLDRLAVEPLKCGFGTPCGRTDVIVLGHPVHATTDAQGRFRIDNVPAGQDITIHAWHPLFAESSARVHVGEGATQRIELVLRPADRRDPAPAPAPSPTPQNPAPSPP